MSAVPLESRRGRARLAAVGFLYEHELNPSENQVEAMERNFEHQKIRPGVADYARELAGGVLAHLDQIDGILKDHLINWEIHRLSVLDRCVLRAGIFEMLYFSGEPHKVPHKVCINEMVEAAKLYGHADSAGFVNGILDAVRRSFEAREKRGHG